MSIGRRRAAVSFPVHDEYNQPIIDFTDLKEDVALLSPIHQYVYRPTSLQQVVDETHFSKNEIRAIYRAFKETSPNAVINKSILREKFAELFPHGDIEHYSDMLFDTFDNDGNGTINFQEFVKALSILCRGTMDEKLDWLYKLYDPKDKGEITWHRLFYVITSTDDLMGNGRRARPLLTREQRAQHAHNVFKKFDIGKRGRISKEDFFTVCRTDRQIIESMSALYTILPG
ncbi:Neuronal Calcium Sensor family [Trichostrongylus colubriformis]|uniref:Neuronal Calcium Sensor family n=1 Tax=Trichostrongylus colubriformis TaxID=6319 RepID=A0AAN8FDU9_TRICO